jgi:hypothetical protein
MNQRGKIMKKAKNLLMLVAILISSCAQISSSENSGSSGSSIGSYTDSSSSSSEPIMSYTVTWKNYDGTTLEVDTVAYGTMPSYDGATPTKDSSAQYTYTFSGWSPEVVAVTDDAIYTAQFSGAINYYTVTWKNYDGTTLEVDNVAYGAMPSYDGATPTKDSDAQYTYTFSGWSPDVSTVTGDATYTAQYSDAVNSYTVTWKNYDGTTLEVDTVAYGTMPSYDGATPVRDSDAQYAYIFGGWSPEVSSVTGDVTYIAQFSSEARYDLIFDFSITGSEITIMGLKDSEMVDLYIPSTIQGYKVTSIGTEAFIGNSKLRTLSIGDNVALIGSFAFSGCRSLTSITIPFVGATRTTTGASSYFGYIFGTTSYTGGKAINQNGTTYYIPSVLTSVMITDTSSIGNYAFQNCKSLKSITIPNSVTSIGNYAFENCTSLTSITIPNSVNSIGSGAFSGCTSLTSITIPESVTSIGNSAFSRCTSLTSITIPNSVTSIVNYAFQNCTSLTSITIPNSVTSIGKHAFQNCTSLTSITVGNYVTSIGDYAFSGCTSLTSITIPESVTSIGSGAFSGCTSLKSITIPESVTSIGYRAFSGCTSLTSITIPNSVTSIGNYAFQNCTSLKSITIPNSVNSIGSGAFSGCTSLTIYAEAESRPFGWDSSWNPNSCPVIWGYKS